MARAIVVVKQGISRGVRPRSHSLELQMEVTKPIHCSLLGRMGTGALNLL